MGDLWIEDRKKVNGEIELCARFEYRGGQHRVWYKVETRNENKLTSSAEPFLLGTLMIAMNKRENLRVHGQVSPSLLRNLENFQQAWSVWEPEMYGMIEITAEQETESEYPVRKGVITCFSGGVDSCYPAFRHARGITTSFPLHLQAAVFVHGFDIPLSQNEVYESAHCKIKIQLDSLGLELYRVRTNFKEESIFWPHEYGPGVASVLSLFQKQYSAGIIAQGVPFSSYKYLPEGSNPLSDPLLSSSSFAIIPDGGAFTRSDKIKVISEWPEGMKYLRVCWEGEEKDRNCCVCEKCIRNILTFRSLGIPLPKSFPVDVSDDQIFRLGPLIEIKISVSYDFILEDAASRGMGKESWVKALKKAIHRSRVITKLWSTPFGRFKLRLIRIFRKTWRQPVSIVKF